nr:hypothetical protein [Tanacetum cinerariifolium]
PSKDFEAKYNKVKAKLTLLSSSASASKALMVKNKGLIVEAYECDEEKVSSDDNEMVKVKVLMALAKDNDSVSKEGARYANDTKVSIPGVERPWLSKVEGFNLPNHDTGRILLAESQRNTTDPSVAIIDSLATEIIFVEREINPRNTLHTFKRCEVCGSSTHTTTDHYDIEWFKRGEALQAEKVEALKSNSVESSNANRSKTPTKR